MKNILSSLCALILFQGAFCQSADSADYYYKKGLEEKAGRRYMVAYNNFQKSVNIKKDNADAQTELGLTALELRKYDNAEMAFLKVTELKKDDRVAIENLADIYFWTHQWKQAETF